MLGVQATPKRFGVSHNTTIGPRFSERKVLMKKFVIGTFCAALMMAASANANLIITGLGDPDGGEGDILELYATANIADLSIYGIATANNSGSLAASPSSTLAGGTLNAGDFYYVTTDLPDFLQFFGFSADEDLNLSINGNDTIGLYENGALIDRVLADADDSDVHGDGWIYRNDGSGPNTAYNASEWTIEPNSLASSNDSTNAASTTPMPVGTYVPEPTTGLLLVLGALGLGFVRRR